MKNTMKLFGIIALVAVIGLSMAACSNDADANSLEGNWVSSTTIITIKGTGGNIKEMRNLDALWQSAQDRGYIKIGTQYFRSLAKKDYLTWTGQVLTIQRATSSSNVCTGTYWRACTITMNENGRAFILASSTPSGTTTVTYTRQ